MAWYIAKLIFEIHQEPAQLSLELEEKLVLIEATDMKHAYEKSKQWGLDHQEGLQTVNGRKLTWQFLLVHTLDLIGAITDGAEVFSCTRDVEFNEQHLELIRYQAARLEASIPQVQTA